MSTNLGWRVTVLQGVLVVVLGFCASFLFWGGNFTHSQINAQLAEQKVSFPAATSPAITALPKSDAAAMRQYAGQELTTGDQAKVYADNFIAVHLGEMGMTYSQASEKFLACQPPTGTCSAATITKLGGLRTTIFMGTMLRSSLLSAYAWWTVGTYAIWAGFVVLLGAFVVLGSLIFELALAYQRKTRSVTSKIKLGAPITA